MLDISPSQENTRYWGENSIQLTTPPVLPNYTSEKRLLGMWLRVLGPPNLSTYKYIFMSNVLGSPPPKWLE